MKLAIFDLDNTFVDTNTTFDFISFFLSYKKKDIKLVIYKTLIFLPLPNKRDMALRFLKGESEESLKESAEIYGQDVLKPKINHEVFARFSALKDKGYLPIFISSAPEFIFRPFAESLNFSACYGSSLAFEGEKCQGRIKEDLTGQKNRILDEKYDIADLRNSYFFSDNHEDSGAMLKVGNPFGVISDNAEEEFWRSKGVGIIKVGKRYFTDSKSLFFPGFYYYSTRIGSGWVYFIYNHIGFLLLSAYLLHKFKLLTLFLAMWAYIGLYEIGEFMNDVISTGKESSPTQRVDFSLSKKLNIFIVSRVLFFSFVLFTLKAIGYNLAPFLAGNLVVVAIFMIHNNLNEKYRIITFGLLKASHFVIPLIIFPVDIRLPLLAYVFFYAPEYLVYYFFKKVRYGKPGYGLLNMIFVISSTALVLTGILYARGFVTGAYLFWIGLYILFYKALVLFKRNLSA